MVKDPVCKMDIEEEKAAGTSQYQGRTYYFCAESCRESFDAEPEKFAGDGGGEVSSVPGFITPAQAGKKGPSPGSKRIDLPVTGMSCASCASNIQNALSGINGVESASVNFAAEKAAVVYDPSRTSVRDFIRTIKDIGYGVSVSRISVPVKGMTCASCVKKVQDALSSVNGVQPDRGSL